MRTEINESNYEEFYLDYLEGNLSGELLVAFEAFLDEHPELIVSDELYTLEPSEEEINGFDKLLLKKQVAITELNANTVDYFLIAQLEGQLSPQDNALLNNWMEVNPQFKKDAALIAATRSEADLTVVYEDKGQLLKKGRIIPLWLSGVAAAAAVLLLFVTIFREDTTVSKQTTTASVENGVVIKHISVDGTDDEPLTAQTQNSQAAEKHAAKTTLRAGTVQRPSQGPGKTSKRLTTEVSDLEQRKAILPVSSAQLAEISLPAATASLANSNEQTAYNSVDKMTNPIKPITNAISDKLDTPVDFRTAKASKKKGGGFYLKVGKLEISHQTASL